MAASYRRTFRQSLLLGFRVGLIAGGAVAVFGGGLQWVWWNVSVLGSDDPRPGGVPELLASTGLRGAVVGLVAAGITVGLSRMGNERATARGGVEVAAGAGDPWRPGHVRSWRDFREVLTDDDEDQGDGDGGATGSVLFSSKGDR